MNNVVIYYLKFNAGLIGVEHQRVQCKRCKAALLHGIRFKPNTPGYVAYLVIYVKILCADALVFQTSVFFCVLVSVYGNVRPNSWDHKAHGCFVPGSRDPRSRLLRFCCLFNGFPPPFFFSFWYECYFLNKGKSSLSSIVSFTELEP